MRSDTYKFTKNSGIYCYAGDGMCIKTFLFERKFFLFIVCNEGCLPLIFDLNINFKKSISYSTSTTCFGFGLLFLFSVSLPETKPESYYLIHHTIS
jgi:hypothetical protein